MGRKGVVARVYLHPLNSYDNPMLILIGIIISALLIFIVALLSPRKGSVIQRKIGRALALISDKVRRKPKAVKLLVETPAVNTHKVLHKSASLGKRGRNKLPL